MKAVLVFCLCLALALAQTSEHPEAIQAADVVMEVGQIFPGKIDAAQSKQNMHYLKVNQLDRKYLFLRVNVNSPVKLSMGLYSNETKQLVFGCEDNVYDSCYIPVSSLAANTVYVVLIVANEDLQYNLYTYWGDLEHIKPNQQIKFIFDQTNPTQLFHLQLDEKTNFEQVRIVLRPETVRSPGDNLRIYAKLGFKSEPTVREHDFASSHVWGQSQAILLSKNDLQGQRGIGIYIVGSAETVYVLECELVQTYSHNLKVNQTLNQFLPKEQETFYEMSFSQNSNVSSFVIKLAVYTGEVEIAFYYDKQFRRVYEKVPYQYMSDMQFNFDKNDFEKDAKEIFMRVRCPDSPATYSVITQARNKDTAFELQENVYEFSALNDPSEAMYIENHIFSTGNFEEEKKYSFEFSVIKIFGDPVFEFYLCKPGADESKCKNPKDKQFSSAAQRVKPNSNSRIGSKLISTLEVLSSAYSSVNNVEKKLLILVIARNQGKANSAYAIQYATTNRVRMLREGRAFEDKVKIQEKKLYKYLNNNPSVSQITIHVNEVSGLTKIRAKRQSFTLAGGSLIELDKETPNTIVIKDKVTDPIYLEVTGVVASIYTVSVSAAHSEHTISNALVMAEDIEYEVKLLPYQHINIELHPIEASVVFDFYAEGGSVVVCEVDINDVCKGDNLAGSHGQIKINAASTREIRLRVGNFLDASQLIEKNSSNKSIALPELVRKVSLTLIYHGEARDHCEERKINKIHSQNVKAGSCFKFHLPIKSDIQILASRSDLAETDQSYFLCTKRVVPAEVNNRFVIRKNVIEQTCAETPDDLVLEMVVTDKSGKMEEVVKMDYAVEYGNDIITLADGVAYDSIGTSTPDVAIRTFFYEILDEDRDINIVLYNKKGVQKLYAVVLNKTERYNGQVTEAQAVISSKNSNYYLNPYIKVTPQVISSAKCGRSCVLALSIYSQEKTGNQIQYAIEVTQNHIFLGQDEIKKGFLPKDSAQFYEYESKSDKGSLIFKVSDNNRKCARALMSRNPFPTASNFYLKENDGTIIFDKKTKGTYYFAVEAKQDCPYSVSVSEENAKITKIEFGEFYDVSLKKGEQKWFFLKHASTAAFRVLSLNRFGQLSIYANETKLVKETMKELEDGKLKKESFGFRSSYRNTLTVKADSKYFCNSCYYIICVQAMRDTEGSIFVASDTSKISLTENKILFDEIQTKNATTYANFYRVSDGKLEVKVHVGKINFEMAYRDQKFSKQFSHNKKVFHQAYNFTRDDGVWSPVELRITALEVPAVYSFQLIPSSDSKLASHKITPGEHSYVHLSGGLQECLVGTLNSRNQEIFISVNNAATPQLEKLLINVTLNGKDTDKFTSELVGNIHSIRFKPQALQTAEQNKYRICMSTESSNDSLAVFAFQNQNVNLIHPDTEALVRGESKFVLYPNNDVIVDVFECSGSAQIYYSSSLNKIREKQSHKLDVIGIPGQSHAIKISEFSTLYLDVVAELATVQWMPIKSAEERGVGYFKYAIGDLQYESEFNSINFKIGGVYQAKETKTTVKSITYYLIVANSKKLLQEAVMCEKYASTKLLRQSIRVQAAGTSNDYEISIPIQKKIITDTFSPNETLYFNVAAQMVLLPPETKDQNAESYKFIYFEQMVPALVFAQNKVEAMNLKVGQLIGLLVAIVVGFIVTSCVFAKYVVPALGRLKNRVLVEEKDDPKDKSMPLPPSSDRGEIPNVPSGTEDEMR